MTLWRLVGSAPSIAGKRQQSRREQGCPHFSHVTPLPPVPHAEVAFEAVAADAIMGGELVAGLGVEAPVGVELRGHAGGELHPRRLLDQLHQFAAEDRGRFGAPVPPYV